MNGNRMVNARAESPRSEVGEIDTRPPFQSVKAAVSLFRQVTFSKQSNTPPRLSSSQPQNQPQTQPQPQPQDTTLSLPHVYDKETQLLLAEQELDGVQHSLHTSLTAKARALSDLDCAQRRAADLRAKLETTKHSKISAIQTKHSMTQRLQQLGMSQSKVENQEFETARENYILVTADLFMGKQELAEIQQEFNLSVEDRLVELQRAEDAQCTSMLNSQKIKNLYEEILEMKDVIDQLKAKTATKKEEEENIAQESFAARETYAAMKREAEQRLDDLKRDYDPEMRRDMDELSNISSQNEGLENLARSIKVSIDERKEAKSLLQDVCNEESFYTSLVGSLTVELDWLLSEKEDLKGKKNEKEKRKVEEGEWADASLKVDRITCEAEKTKKDAEEMRKHVEEQRREAAATHVTMNEAVKQLKIVLRAVEKAKAAEKRAVEDMRALTEKQESLTHEPDKKIRISLQEYEDLRGKQEESDRLVEFKAKTVAAQLEEINESKIEGEKMLEEKLKALEELEVATDAAFRNAEIAEAAHSAVDAELRKWRPEES